MSADRSPEQHGIGLWWAILISGCVISVFLNGWHALTLEKPGTEAPLGLIFALVPVLFAAMLSHGLVTPIVTPWTRLAILSLFAVAMLTSVSSQAAVMRPYGGGYGAEWSIPLVLDASALLALNFIIKGNAAARRAEEEADREAELDALRAELRPGVAAELREQLEAEFAVRETELKASVDRNKEAELAAVRSELRQEHEAELESALAAQEAELSEKYSGLLQAWKEESRRQAESEMEERIKQAVIEAEARVRLEYAKDGGKPRPRVKAIESQKKPAGEAQLSKKEQARVLLQKNPEISGAELGRALGVTERYGCKLLAQLAEEDQIGPAETGSGEVRLVAVN